MKKYDYRTIQWTCPNDTSLRKNNNLYRNKGNRLPQKYLWHIIHYSPF